jgi:hypothetical protein
MKKHLLPLLLVAACFVSILGLNRVKAQDCEAYYPMKKGAIVEMTHFNDKDKVTSITTTTVAKETDEGGKHIVTCDVIIKDGKGKEEGRSTYDVSCHNGEFHMDMKAMSMGQQQQQMQGMENVEIKMESEDMVFPKSLVVGSELPDASMKMTASMSGMTIMNTSVNVTNRKVTGKENLTTPAGTFNCIIIEEDVESHSMGMNIKGHNKSWYALGVGMVRSESSSNGKPQGYTLLTQISGN